MTVLHFKFQMVTTYLSVIQFTKEWNIGTDFVLAINRSLTNTLIFVFSMKHSVLEQSKTTFFRQWLWVSEVFTDTQHTHTFMGRKSRFILETAENVHLKCTQRTFHLFYCNSRVPSCHWNNLGYWQGRHFSKFVENYFEKKDDGKINRLHSAVVIHVRVRAS